MSPVASDGMGEARYDTIVDFYEEQFSGDFADPTTTALFDLAGSLLDRQVLDLGCGHGHLTREIARRGARVVGVDLSATLLERARSAEEREPLGILYVQADVASQTALAGGAHRLSMPSRPSATRLAPTTGCSRRISTQCRKRTCPWTR